MIAVIIPCFRVRDRILDVIEGVGEECARIYVVDDACPEGSGDHVERQCTDSRVRVIRNPANLGVGGATAAGYRQAIADGASVLVKLDGDGQMDPSLIPRLVRPIERGEADYAKGNRFWDLDRVTDIPGARRVGNALLSFLTKASSGYWNVFDPTNGFTALHAGVAARLPLDKLARRWFFESDVLFRLNILRAVVRDVPMDPRYGSETSNLVVSRVVGPFLLGHARNLVKRIFYNYFLHDFSAASIELLIGTLLATFGTVVGVTQWWRSVASGVPATAGTVMLAALPIVVGTQLLLAFVGHDVQAVPRQPVQSDLR